MCTPSAYVLSLCVCFRLVLSVASCCLRLWSGGVSSLACQSRLLVSVESRPSPAPLLDLLLGLAPFLFPLDRIPHRRNKRAATKSVNTDECVRMRSAAVAKYQLQVRDRTALRRATGRQQLSTGGSQQGLLHAAAGALC